MFSGHTFTYFTDKANNLSFKREAKAIFAGTGLNWLSMTYDAFKTEKGKTLAWEFMKRRNVAMILDESGRIKNPKAQITKMMVGKTGKPGAGAYATMRRVLDGTPVPNSPLDVFTPIQFLSSVFWHQHRFSNFHVFSRYFGTWIKMKAPQGHSFEVCKGYRNLDELEGIVKGITTRVLKEDVLDLPPKLYNKHTFEMTTKQRRVYDEIRTEYFTEIGGGEVWADLAIVRLLRLAQVTAGYLPVEDDDENVTMVPIDTVNPRLEAFSQLAQDMPHKCLVWARFRQDVDLIAERLNRLYRKGEVRGKAVVYHGGSTESEMAHAREVLQRGSLEDCQWFVATQAKGHSGITLHKAKSTIYYNNTFRLDHRLQSEDRNHRAGMDTYPVNYTDVVALNAGLPTIDGYTLGALLSKFDISKLVTGDHMREWLS
jgi:SNF2 family DNA or RNA helicase